MGAWGVGALENDSGQDWLAEFGEVGADAVVEVLEAADEAISDSYLDSDLGSAIVVAAEVVATAMGHANPALSAMLADAVPPHQEAIMDIDDVQIRTAKALDAVLADSEVSELCELWEESDDFSKWSAQVSELQARVGSE